MKARLKSAMFFFLVMVWFTEGLTWNTKMRSAICCQCNKQLLTWNFTKEENERVTGLHWFFNEKTLVCFVSNTTGFLVADLYEGRVERNGTAGILLKNVSLNDTGKYTLYVKLEEEKERNVQGINLTVVEPPPNQCKPKIKTEHLKGIISCFTSCEKSPLSLEWIINGTEVPWGIGPYFVVNSSRTSEQPICCLRDFKCLDYETKFCTQNNISFIEDIHKANQSLADTKCMDCTSILVGLSVTQVVLIVVIACVILNGRRLKSFIAVHKRDYATTDDIEIELEESLSEEAFPMFSKDEEPSADVNDVIPDPTMCRDKSIPSNSVSTQDETSPMLTTDQEPNADAHDAQVPGKPSSILGTVQKLEADIKLEQRQEKIFPMFDTDDQQVKLQETVSTMLEKLQRLEASLQHIREQVAVEPKHSNIVAQCKEDLQQVPAEAATTDRPLQNSNQQVHIVNNSSIDTDCFKIMLHSHTALVAELRANRKETKKLNRQLHRKTDLRKKENIHKYLIEMAQEECSDFKNNDTTTSETSVWEDAYSDDTDTSETSEWEDAYSGAMQWKDTNIELETNMNLKLVL